MSPQVLVRLDPSLDEELTMMAKMLGVSKAELMRLALREFLSERKELKTSKMRGIVKSKLSLENLEEMYQVGR